MVHALQTLLLLSFPALVLFAAARDAVTYIIPNWISLAAVAAFVPAAALLGLGPPALLGALGAGLVFLAAGVALFCLGWIGGGDAKLMAACALWIGWPGVVNFLVWTAIAGGALAAGLLVLRPLVQGRLARAPAWFGRLMTVKGDVPYGVAIAAGALVAFPASALAGRVL